MIIKIGKKKELNMLTEASFSTDFTARAIEIIKNQLEDRLRVEFEEITDFAKLRKLRGKDEYGKVLQIKNTPFKIRFNWSERGGKKINSVDLFLTPATNPSKRIDTKSLNSLQIINELENYLWDALKEATVKYGKSDISKYPKVIQELIIKTAGNVGSRSLFLGNLILGDKGELLYTDGKFLYLKGEIPTNYTIIHSSTGEELEDNLPSNIDKIIDVQGDQFTVSPIVYKGVNEDIKIALYNNNVYHINFNNDIVKFFENATSYNEVDILGLNGFYAQYLQPTSFILDKGLKILKSNSMPLSKNEVCIYMPIRMDDYRVSDNIKEYENNIKLEPFYELITKTFNPKSKDDYIKIIGGYVAFIDIARMYDGILEYLDMDDLKEYERFFKRNFKKLGLEEYELLKLLFNNYITKNVKKILLDLDLGFAYV